MPARSGFDHISTTKSNSTRAVASPNKIKWHTENRHPRENGARKDRQSWATAEGRKSDTTESVIEAEALLKFRPVAGACNSQQVASQPFQWSF
jgi:hypothetical protein